MRRAHHGAPREHPPFPAKDPDPDVPCLRDRRRDQDHRADWSRPDQRHDRGRTALTAYIQPWNFSPFVGASLWLNAAARAAATIASTASATTRTIVITSPVDYLQIELFIDD